MERLQKIILLIEDNPIVKDFNDIETILKNVFTQKIKLISNDLTKNNFNFNHGGRNQSYNLINQESRTYEILIAPTVSYTIKITGYNLQTSDKYFIVNELIINEVDLVETLKQSI